MKTMHVAGAFVLGLLGYGVSQESYGTWRAYREVTLNTTSSGGGAGVSGKQTNFPVLVRLTSAQDSVFIQSQGSGGDIRFTKADGTTRLKHQIERWDSAGRAAEVWVLLDSVSGNGSTLFRMYYGKAGAADSSNGPAVFSHNFQGVFHLGEATGDTVRDASVNRFKGIPRNRGGVNPQDTVGAIGKAKNFLGNNANNNGGSYRIVTSTGGNTYTGNALNFQNDSSTILGLPLYTISAWINPSSFPSGTAYRKGIISKSAGTVSQQYFLRLRDPAPHQIDSTLDTQMVDFSDGVTAAYRSGDLRLTKNNWFYVTAVRKGVLGVLGNVRICVNATSCFDGGTSLTQTSRSDFDVFIGSFSNDSGYFSGKIDEVTFSDTSRSADWQKLCYENQKPGATMTVIGPSITPPPVPVFAYRTSPLVLTSGSAMTPDTPVVTVGSVTSWSVSPSLPAGLGLSATTGIVSGTPSAGQASSSYTVTGTGPGGPSSVALPIAVNAAPTLTSQPATPATVTSSTNSTKIGIKATGFPSALTYKWVRVTKANVTDTVPNGGIYGGATTDTLTLTNATNAEDSLQFRCVVANSAGQAVSNTVRLRVQIPSGILGPYMVRVKGLSAFTFPVPEGIGSVRMTAEDMKGRVVWSKDMEVGKSRLVSWHGADREGRPVSSGMYVVKLRMLSEEGKTLGEMRQVGSSR
jgi:hypothetical protein